MRKHQAEGIWYLVREVDKWKLIPCKFRPKSSIEGHPGFWERIVASRFARAYKLSKSAARELALHAYGFPRGRVALVDGALKFYHGNDWQRFISREEIEKHFNPDGGGSQWVFDEHETQLDWDREQVGRVLGMGDGNKDGLLAILVDRPRSQEHNALKFRKFPDRCAPALMPISPPATQPPAKTNQ